MGRGSRGSFGSFADPSSPVRFASWREEDRDCPRFWEVVKEELVAVPKAYWTALAVAWLSLIVPYLCIAGMDFLGELGGVIAFLVAVVAPVALLGSLGYLIGLTCTTVTRWGSLGPF
jgi:hypothetical protein